MTFELLLDMPDLQIALVDGTLYASTALADATDDDALAAVGAAMLEGIADEMDDANAEPLQSFRPLEWTPPAN